MTSDYDEIGSQYLLTKSIPWKRFAERYTFFKAIGPLRGLRVIDVACGTGYYSRMFRDAGAAQVVGVDISAEMVHLAREQEAGQAKPISYVVADAGELGAFADRTGLGEFDLAVAEWLLDYAQTREHLSAMCRSLAHILRPGGRFVHLGGCFNSIFHHPDNFPRYGIELEILESHGDGSRCRWTVRSDDQSVSAENTMWTPETIDAELNGAGFIDVKWPLAEIAPDGIEEMGEDYWTEFLKHPYHAVTCATRSVTVEQ